MQIEEWESVNPKLIQEIAGLDNTVQWFASEMKNKLAKKMSEGFAGWDNIEFVDSGTCATNLSALSKKLLDGDTSQAVDIANFAMFIAWRESKKDQ